MSKRDRTLGIMGSSFSFLITGAVFFRVTLFLGELFLNDGVPLPVKSVCVLGAIFGVFGMWGLFEAHQIAVGSIIKSSCDKLEGVE